MSSVGNWADGLLRPGSIALVGVSDDPAKTSGRPLQFLERGGYSGTIYPVNPSRRTVQEHKAFPSVADLPECPDHAFIITGSQLALDALEECEALGVPVATILAGGFAEAGEKGRENELRLREIIARGRVRVLGPSSIGLVNLHHRMVLTVNAAFAEPNLPKGGIFVGSHSGSLIGALVSRGKRMGIGFAGLVSVGGETDLSIGEVCAATLDDPAITSYMLFLETMHHADALRAFALEAARRGKPVAAYKLGRSQAAAELAVSHTGSLAGADEVADAFLRECGIARVDSFEGLIEIMPLLPRVKPATAPRKGRVGVVTTTGGGAAMAVDQISQRGAIVEPPTKETRARLAASGVDGGHGRIVDLTLAGVRYEVMKATLDVLLTAPEFDMVLATVGSSARFHPDLAVQPIIDAQAEHEKPLAAFIVPDAPDAIRLLAGAGVPVFGNPETCGDAVAAALARRTPRDHGVPMAAVGIEGMERLLDEEQAYGLLNEAGVTSAPVVLLDPDAPVPELPFDYPVVAKVLHEEIAHKSDVGGVVLGIADAPGLSNAVREIAITVAEHRPGTEVRRILVQPMVEGIGEVLVGFRRDPEVGPLVMLAAGGIFTELYRDSAIRLAPVDAAGAREMIGEVKATAMLTGYRGKQAGDMEALVEAIVAVSRLGLLKDRFVAEAEINPLLVLPEGEGVLAIDGLVRLIES